MNKIKAKSDILLEAAKNYGNTLGETFMALSIAVLLSKLMVLDDTDIQYVMELIEALRTTKSAIEIQEIAYKLFVVLN